MVVNESWRDCTGVGGYARELTIVHDSWRECVRIDKSAWEFVRVAEPTRLGKSWRVLERVYKGPGWLHWRYFASVGEYGWDLSSVGESWQGWLSWRYLARVGEHGWDLASVGESWQGWLSWRYFARVGEYRWARDLTRMHKSWRKWVRVVECSWQLTGADKFARELASVV